MIKGKALIREYNQEVYPRWCCKGRGYNAASTATLERNEGSRYWIYKKTCRKHGIVYYTKVMLTIPWYLYSYGSLANWRGHL